MANTTISWQHDTSSKCWESVNYIEAYIKCLSWAWLRFPGEYKSGKVLMCLQSKTWKCLRRNIKGVRKWHVTLLTYILRNVQHVSNKDNYWKVVLRFVYIYAVNVHLIAIYYELMNIFHKEYMILIFDNPTITFRVQMCSPISTKLLINQHWCGPCGRALVLVRFIVLAPWHTTPQFNMNSFTHSHYHILTCCGISQPGGESPTFRFPDCIHLITEGVGSWFEKASCWLFAPSSSFFL